MIEFADSRNIGRKLFCHLFGFRVTADILHYKTAVGCRGGGRSFCWMAEWSIACWRFEDSIAVFGDEIVEFFVCEIDWDPTIQVCTERDWCVDNRSFSKGGVRGWSWRGYVPSWFFSRSLRRSCGSSLIPSRPFCRRFLVF